MQAHAHYFYEYIPKAADTIVLRPNLVYPASGLQGDALCPRALTKEIQVRFFATYRAQEHALLSMHYTVGSVISGQMETGQTLWSRTASLRVVQTVPKEDAALQLQETVPCDLKPYEAFAQQAIAATGVMPEHVRLIIRIQGELTAETAYGTMHQPIELSAEIPLLQPVFAVKLHTADPVRGHLTAAGAVRKPISKPLVGGCIAVICAGSGFVVFLLRGTRSPNRNDRIRRRIHHILRQYRHRIVALRQASDSEEYYTQYEVSGINDLMRVSREIDRPVFYLLPTDHTQTIQGNCFYVQTAAARYVCHIE